jgi:hypothetical protein
MNEQDPLSAGSNGTGAMDLNLTGAGGGGNSGDRMGSLVWPGGEPVWAPPLQPGESISLTVGGERPSYPSTGNIATMAMMSEVSRTFETTAGMIQTSDGNDPVVFTLSHSWAEQLLKGEGPKRAQYADFVEKKCFFSRDEDRYRHREWDLARLEDATNCEGDFEDGDVSKILEPRRAYLQWLLNGGMPLRFLGHHSYRTDEDGADQAIHQYNHRITVCWQTSRPYRFDTSHHLVPVNVFCWDMPAERFRVYIDNHFNVTYSFTFEERNMSACFLPGRRPKELGEALDRFAALHPMPIIHNHDV